MDGAFKDISNSVNYILPKEIAIDYEDKSFKNLINMSPKDYLKKTGKIKSSVSGTESQSQQNESKSNSGKEIVQQKDKSNSNDSHNEENRNQNKNLINNSSEKNNKRKEKIKFGQHANYSFFESYSRELIFQLFNYHELYFFNYEVTKGELNKKDEDEKIEGNNSIKNSEVKDHSKQKADIVNIEVQKTAEEINTEENKESQEETNSPKLKNQKKEKNKNPEKEIYYKGDIDFLIPNLSPNELKDFLNNKDYAPFIFYDNIKPGVNSDIIGEIKESISTSDKKHIKQLLKK